MSASGSASKFDSNANATVGVVVFADSSNTINPCVEGHGCSASSVIHDDVISNASQEPSDPELALHGINLMLNNGFKESEDLFNKHKQRSPLMSVGASFVKFLHALMTFEEEQMEQAAMSLRHTERQCMQSQDGFMKAFKNRVMRRSPHESASSLEDRLQKQVIIADCQLYQAILTFVNQELSGYLRGGWILRRAWKIYEKAYKEIQDLHDRYSRPISPRHSQGGNFGSHGSKQDSLTRTISAPVLQDVAEIPSQDVLDRLMGSVSFGFGVFQLCVSLMPPNLLRVIQFLGFEGDRDIGLDALILASKSRDMKAPLAMLALLWYHTVVRPFFSLDGVNIEAGVSEAMAILKNTAHTYPNSALFLFFHGRVLRLKCKISEALAAYHKALAATKDQREIQLICLYEIGWCNLLQLNWIEAKSAFLRLRLESRWSQCYYAYLAAICLGALGHSEECYKVFCDVPRLVKRKNYQIEIFVGRRCFEECLQRCQGQTEDLHVQAFAMYEFGCLLIRSSETAPKGKALLLHAKTQLCDYDFENRLNVRIHAALRRVQKMELGNAAVKPPTQSTGQQSDVP
ncbi:PREDICTED: tetratricopeptide repeat protein 39C-like isoform X2 [Priapulus caudatus]|uniref:Tetratricopeptide repeat protein 39C-like isoform X2 n=1 Tax=Priapulus caudatus TaxID=37621 RepID=A0ABM1DQD4_PRICU|nr:PREDICTED: tetratricopeptide repeat protein 39C-like isoform X2 [Priapulus caudatus]